MLKISSMPGFCEILLLKTSPRMCIVVQNPRKPSNSTNKRDMKYNIVRQSLLHKTSLSNTGYKHLTTQSTVTPKKSFTRKNTTLILYG